MKFIIDADVIIYQSCLTNVRDLEVLPGEWLTRFTQGDAAETAESMVDYWINAAAGAVGETPAEVVLVVSDLAENFRKELDFVDYKGNRDGKRPLGWGAHRAWFVENYEAKSEPRLEGDDLCGLLQSPGDVVLSIDKDMLTLPGLVWRPDHGLVEVTRADAERAFYAQVCMGDRVDGYYGIPNCGPVGAEKILAKPGPVWDNIVAAYEKAGLGEPVALANARCARILRGDDYDFTTKEVRLWTPSLN